MAFIAFPTYVDITSAVIGAGGVRVKDMILRLFTILPIQPIKTIYEFNSADDVGIYYGTDTDEYKMAQFYFGWVSLDGTKPEKISFSRWTPDDSAPTIFGKSGTYKVGDFTSVIDGALKMVDGTNENAVGSLDFSGAVTLADIAAVLQAGIRLIGTGYYSSCTVTYNTTAKRFEFTGGSTGATATIGVTDPASGTNVIPLIGWGAGAIFSAGADAQTVTDILIYNDTHNTNFASFDFAGGITSDQWVEALTWLATKNFDYAGCVPIDITDVDPEAFPYTGFAGAAVTATNSLDNEYPELIPAIQAAATDYSFTNATSNYMYKVFNVTPLQFDGEGIDTEKAAQLDALLINYYASTQDNGQIISFYQRGKMQGNTQAAKFQNIFFNEVWLKSYAGSRLMSLQLSSQEISASETGRAQIMAVLAGDVVTAALKNGIIQAGKTFTQEQIGEITTISGNRDAWQQVQSIGWWLEVDIIPVNNNNSVEYFGEYTLIYSKDDVVLKLVGRHILV